MTVDEWVKYDSTHRTRMAFCHGITGLWQASRSRSTIVCKVKNIRRGISAALRSYCCISCLIFSYCERILSGDSSNSSAI